MKGFKSTSTNPYTYTQSGVWKKGQYTFQAVVKSDSGYAFAFQRSDTTWQTVDLSWQVKDGSYSKIQWTFTLEVDAVAFRLIANTVTGETTVVQPMLEKGTNGSTPIAHEEDLRGMDGDFHEFIFTRNDTGIAPPTPLSTQENDHIPIDDSVEPPVIWTDNPQGVTKELPFEFVSMREKKNGVWLNFSPPSLWAKWGEDGLSVNLHVEGHYNSKWVGVTKVTEIIGGVDVGGSKVVKASAVFRKGETNIAATEAQSRGFQWYVNNVHLTEFDDQPYITLDETYGDGFADYVVLSYLVNSLREEERREILNVSEGMDGIGEEFIFKANNSDTTPPVLPQTTDAGYQDDDYYGQGTANEWNDDPVAPTEVLQFVWVAKRKKVGGEWQAFGVPSVWTKWVTDGDGILEVLDYYGLSSSESTLPTTWYNTVPSKGTNEYLWNYERIYYSDLTYDETQARVIQGKDAKSISTIVNQYVYSSSDTSHPTSGWKPTIAELGAKPEGYFLWVRDFITYTDGTTSTTDGYVVTDGGDGEDGITISPNQQGYTYRADLNGDIIGSLAKGMVELTITSGSTPITCSSASGGTPTTNGTYRVTRTLGNGITTNSSLSGGKYRITPATLTVDEASVELEIKIMMGGVVTSYPLTLTYRKQFDGADGKSTEFIFKGHTSDNTAPTLPSTSQQDDWYGQGTANEWNDDLVEPTKSLPYVWASQRKKVDGVWGAFTIPKVWLRYAEDGDGITSTTIHYAKSSSGTTPPSSGWSTSLPSPTMGWYLWTRTTTTYKVAETTVSYSVSHWAEDGDGIVSTTIEYVKSSSGTTIPTSGWSTSLPTPTKGWYLWTRTTTVYKTSPTTVAYSTSYWSEDGDDAKSLILSASSLTMACYSTNEAKPGQTITINAKLQNVTGNASFDATPYNVSGTALTKITLGGSGNTKTLTSSQWLSTFQKVVITATLSGLSDSITITRLPDGGDGDPAKSIHLNPSAKAISITKGNIPVPASVTVTGTAVNTTIQYWYYSVNGAASFTGTPPTGVTRSGNQVTINSATAKFKTLSIKARNSSDDVEDVVTITRGGGAPYVDETTNTWWEWDEELSIYTDTGMSPVGSDGRIPYPAGYWEAKTYTRDADYAPYVQHTMAVYLLVADSALSTDVPGTSNKWKAFNNWQAVFVDSLVAKFAKIGGAVFTGNTDPSSTIKGRMISEMGASGSTNYKSYTGDGGAWQPKLMLDFLTGKVKFTDAEITGVINALSGDIGDFTIEDGYLTAVNQHMMQTPGGEMVQVTSTIQLTPSGIKIYNSYGGTTDHPQVISWNTEVTAGGIKVGDFEMRKDGIYKNGTKVL